MNFENDLVNIVNTIGSREKQVNLKKSRFGIKSINKSVKLFIKKDKSRTIYKIESTKYYKLIENEIQKFCKTNKQRIRK